MCNKKDDRIQCAEGGENVFADLGLPHAEERLAKAKLALSINKILMQRKLKQADAAQLLGVDQSKISLLKKGRLSGFSMERLTRFLTLLDQDVDIVVRRKTAQYGRVSVVHAHV